jgi:hypothetical protein
MAKDPMTGIYRSSGQVLIIRAAAAGVWRRDPTIPALARPPDASGADADGVPRDWVQGTHSTHTVRLRAPLASSRKRSLTEPSPCSYPTTTEFYRDLGLLPGQLDQRIMRHAPLVPLLWETFSFQWASRVHGWVYDPWTVGPDLTAVWLDPPSP